MIRINLLPFRAARKKENIRRQVSVFVLTFSFTAMAMFYYNGVLSSKVTGLEKNIETAQAELATFRKTIAEIKRIKRALSLLKNKTAIINRLKKNRKWPLTFMDTMNEMVIEKRMWLTSLTTKGRDINIKGIALDNKTVADFMTRLEASKQFTAVNLKSVIHKKIKKYSLKNFQITCKKSVPKKPKKKKSDRPRAKK